MGLGGYSREIQIRRKLFDENEEEIAILEHNNVLPFEYCSETRFQSLTLFDYL